MESKLEKPIYYWIKNSTLFENNGHLFIDLFEQFPKDCGIRRHVENLFTYDQIEAFADAECWSYAPLELQIQVEDYLKW